MPKKLRIGVIFGGRSGEHEVSIRSARSVIDAIDKSKYDVIPIAITKEGNWLGSAASSRLLPPETQKRMPANATANASGDVAILGDPSRTGLVRLDSEDQSTERLDVVLPVLHGTYG